MRNKPVISLVLAGAIASACAISTTTRSVHALDIYTQSVTSQDAEKEASAPRQRWSASDFAHLRTAPDHYWDRVAQCETQTNWRDGGRFAGGLGIAVTTWRNYGGRQFAASPDRATRRQQIEIANRISIYGFQTKRVFLSEADIPHRPFFRPPVGFNGWGCIRNNEYLQPPVAGPWKQRRSK